MTEKGTTTATENSPGSTSTPSSVLVSLTSIHCLTLRKTMKELPSFIQQGNTNSSEIQKSADKTAALQLQSAQVPGQSTQQARLLRIRVTWIAVSKRQAMDVRHLQIPRRVETSARVALLEPRMQTLVLIQRLSQRKSSPQSREDWLGCS